MVNANADALGIIFPNSYDEQVPDLVNERLMEIGRASCRERV